MLLLLLVQCMSTWKTRGRSTLLQAEIARIYTYIYIYVYKYNCRADAFGVLGHRSAAPLVEAIGGRREAKIDFMILSEFVSVADRRPEGGRQHESGEWRQRSRGARQDSNRER